MYTLSKALLWDTFEVGQESLIHVIWSYLLARRMCVSAIGHTRWATMMKTTTTAIAQTAQMNPRLTCSPSGSASITALATSHAVSTCNYPRAKLTWPVCASIDGNIRIRSKHGLSCCEP